MQVTRVEKHVISKNSEWFQMLDHFCFLSKNLYNHANYLIRKKYLEDGTWLRYNELNSILKDDKEYADYSAMPVIAASQQTLRYLDNTWASFFAAIKDWRIHPEKYLGRPKPPKYKHKTKGRYPVYLTYQNCVLKKDGTISFPKTFKGFKLKTRVHERENFVKIQQGRIIPQGNHIVVEIVYLIDAIDTKEVDSSKERYLSLDLGIDNLAAVGNNVGASFYLIDGKGLKSINKYSNKLISHYKSKLMKHQRKKNMQYISKRIQSIYQRRNARIDHYLHTASRQVVNFARYNKIDTIVIGKNDLWKQEVKLGKTTQSFSQIPHARFITMIQYKAEEYGIKVELREEAFTSGTSFLDSELPTREFYNKKRRIKRGLFKTNQGLLVNADCNGAMQIMRKCNKYPTIDNWEKTTRGMISPKRLKVS